MGVVLDQQGLPLLGATLTEKGTNKGATTDFDGRFSLQVSDPKALVVISFIGFDTKEINANDPGISQITLQESINALNEVVVTALGITREEKSLGYAVGKVDEDELTKTVSGNWLNSMSGKVAGLTLDNAGSGPTGSLRVVLRGTILKLWKQ